MVSVSNSLFLFLPSGCFCEAVTNLSGDMLLHDLAQEAGQWSGDGDQNPEHRRENQTDDGDSFKRDSDGMSLIQVHLNLADVGDEFDAMDDDGREKEGDDGEGADGDEQNIDGAGDALPLAAVSAVRQVLLVVGPHSRGEARDVIAPTRENVSDHLINAGPGMLAAVGKSS
jgi:hypothetical protein